MENILLSITNEEVEEREEFIVNTDLKADWCLDKIREEQAEINRFEMVVNAKIEQMKESLESFKKQKQNSIDLFQSKLCDYMYTLDVKPTKTGNKAYKLPSGTLAIKKQQPEFVRDEKELLKFVKENDYKEFLKVKESADWASIKKKVDIVGGNVLIDGQVIQGVSIVERSDKFEVKVG